MFCFWESGCMRYIFVRMRKPIVEKILLYLHTFTLVGLYIGNLHKIGRNYN